MAFMAAPLFTTALTGTVTLGGAMAGLGTVLGLAGASSQADAMRRSAKNAERAAAANKLQADYAAGQAEASSQHEAEAKRRKATLMLSRAQAIAAASGGGPLDETIAGGLIEEGEKDAGYSLYEGAERGKGLRYKGDMGVYEAKEGSRVAKSQARATMLGAFAKAGMSMAGQFAPGAAPGAETIGDTTYYGGAGPDRNWGYGD